MKVKSIPSTRLVRKGHRFDSKPFMSGAMEARMILENPAAEKVPLHELTKGHKGGIYNGPRFSRAYVDSPERGVPFVGGNSMLMADLSNLPLLLKKHACSPGLSHLRLEEGMTLISCSGTVGRMVYVRPDMAGMWSSQDIMKVVPDPGKIPPGYLYAYLSGKFGVPQVVSGT
ncbi:MAG: restriction endonuclease subunit S, partial [Gammaproteobacteria bacterium]|nr:restriction endonuclease subunit S [Gammaproteobacteria bacterium]